MYASSEMTLLDELSRGDLLKIIIDSKNQFRAIRLIRSIKLYENEINEILKNYPYLNNDIDYYQYNKKDTYKKLYESEINEMLKNYPYLNNDIDYYQYNKKDTYKKLYLSK